MLICSQSLSGWSGNKDLHIHSSSDEAQCTLVKCQLYVHRYWGKSVCQSVSSPHM